MALTRNKFVHVQGFILYARHLCVHRLSSLLDNHLLVLL